MMRCRRALLVTGLGLLSLQVSFTKSVAADDIPVPRAPGIRPPGRSLAGTDDSDAMAGNPAQMAWIPAWELRYTRVQLPMSGTTIDPGRGDALGIALPLPLNLGFSTGLRLEWVRPPSAAPVASSVSIAWALAYRITDTLSASFAVRNYSGVSVPSLDTATAFDVGVAWRPSRFIGFAAVGKNLNAPRGRLETELVQVADLGLVLRPWGTRTVEIGLESSVFAHGPGGVFAPRITLGADIPYIGRAVAGIAFADTRDGSAIKNNWTLTAGLEVGLVKGRLGGGIVAGPGLKPGGGAGVGFFASASIAGYIAPGVRATSRGVIIKVESTPGARGHVGLLRRLARLGRDPTVKAVALVLKAEPASSSAHAEELNDAIAALRRRGVRVLCHLEDAGGKSLLSCASADRIVMSPGGGLRFAGLRTQIMYYGEALRRLGIEPDFFRIKEHKSAPESFVREGPTPTATADHVSFLKSVEQIYVDRIGQGRSLSPAQVRAQIAKGPFVADEAIEAGFVDGKSFDDEVPKQLHKLIGEVVRVEKDEPQPIAPASFGVGPRIAVVYIDGDIVDGRSQKIPILNTKTAGSYTVAEALERARKDSSIVGVVLRIESPGGSSLASDVMWREAELLAHAKPVVVSMGSVAASGGYYAAAFGAPIYASRATVTGSIGIFYGKADVSPLLGKLGLRVVTDKTAPRADAESLYRAFTDEERVELAKKVEQFYSVFLDRVARGRGMTTTKVNSLGRGKVWLGEEAAKNGLVDHIGGIEEALADIRAKVGLSDTSPIIDLPKETSSLLDTVMDLAGVEAPVPNVALPKAFAPFVNALTPFWIYGPDQPLALWEGIDAP